MKTLVERIPAPLRALAAWGSLAVGVLFLGLLAGLIWIGNPYAIPGVIYTEKPLPNLLVGLGGVFGWYLFRHGYRNSAREWGRFAGKCLLLAISIVVSFLAGEILLRGYLMREQAKNSMERFKAMKARGLPIKVRSTHPLASIVQPSLNERLVYELQPGLEMDFGHKSLHINSQGMRDSENYTMERRPRSVRIVGIGDSGMFGWNVEQNEDYLSVLETNLNRRGDGVTYEVLNMAVPGYNTDLEVEGLRSRGLAFKPDIVIVGWCDNDFQLPFFMVEKENFRRRDVSYLYYLFFARERLADVVSGSRVRHHSSVKGADADPDLGPEGPIHAVENAMAELKKLADANGFNLLVFGPFERPEGLRICKVAGLATYNTVEKVDAGKYPKEWAVHFMHPRAEGHRVLAEHLEQELDRRGWLKPRS